MAKVNNGFIDLCKRALNLKSLLLQNFSETRLSNVVNSLSSHKVYTLTNFPHFLHPNTALILNEQDDEDETYTPALGIRATYPIQVATNVNAIVQENIVLRLVEQKNKYLNEIEKVTGNYKRSSRLYS